MPQPICRYIDHSVLKPQLTLDQAVRTMLTAAAGRIEVKAAGGIRDRQTAEMFLALGVTRLGATATAAICDETPPPETGGD